jgi:succinate dehydrogenase/fumarate reductase flavoprotein subunit
MPYPPHFKGSLDRVNATREKRKTEEIGRLSDVERTKLIADFHPDYRSEGMAVLQIGPNCGERVPVEFARALESYSICDLDQLDLSKPDYTTEILIIGGGGAGCAAALTARECGADVLLATKLRLGDANTLMAEGGICSAIRPEDNPYLHYIDTIGGGHYTNIPELVKTLVMDGPEIAVWLMEMGVIFDYEADGSLKVNHCGGHSRKRMLSCKDLTGLELMRVLRDELRDQEIPCLEFSPAVELLLDNNGSCGGAVLYNLETADFTVVRAGAVILASGGIGRLHIQGFPTTNHYGATADGLVIAYRAGAGLIHMDSIQYHPTGTVWPEQLLGQLITEVMRGHGAHLVNLAGERFINELECRDTCASACIRECTERGKGVKTPTGHEGIWLDTPLIPSIRDHFVGIYQRFKKYDIDIQQEPILVYPTQHYQNGGLSITADAETSLPGLFAAGEVAGGIQGKNRLAGNSLLDIFVFGRRAARHAVEIAGQVAAPGRLSLEHLHKYHAGLNAIGIPATRRSPVLLPDYTPAGLHTEGLQR